MSWKLAAIPGEDSPIKTRVGSGGARAELAVIGAFDAPAVECALLDKVATIVWAALQQTEEFQQAEHLRSELQRTRDEVEIAQATVEKLKAERRFLVATKAPDLGSSLVRIDEQARAAAASLDRLSAAERALAGELGGAANRLRLLRLHLIRQASSQLAAAQQAERDALVEAIHEALVPHMDALCAANQRLELLTYPETQVSPGVEERLAQLDRPAPADSAEGEAPPEVLDLDSDEAIEAELAREDAAAAGLTSEPAAEEEAEAPADEPPAEATPSAGKGRRRKRSQEATTEAEEAPQGATTAAQA